MGEKVRSQEGNNPIMVSKVLTRNIVFREVIRTLIPSMNIDENGTGYVK